MPLKVIGAGLPRTGTTTLKKSLEALGFGPCYHVSELNNRPDDWSHWLRICGGEFRVLDDVYSEFAATTDTPGCYFYQELAERYPSAKVILSTRPKTEWLESMAATILRLEPPNGQNEALLSRIGSSAFLHRRQNLMRRGYQMDESIASVFDAHHADVLATIDPSRLLVFDVSHGWDSLCRFLGVDPPSASFPHLNKRFGFHTKSALAPLFYRHFKPAHLGALAKLPISSGSASYEAALILELKQLVASGKRPSSEEARAFGSKWRAAWLSASGGDEEIAQRMWSLWGEVVSSPVARTGVPVTRQEWDFLETVNSD